MPDPKLKIAMEEIKDILLKHEIAGAITLVSKTHSEYLYHFPKWSCVSMSDRGLSAYSQKRFYPNAEAQKENVEQSLHIVFQIRDIAAQTFTWFDRFTQMIREKIDIEHRPLLGHEPGE